MGGERKKDTGRGGENGVEVHCDIYVSHWMTLRLAYAGIILNDYTYLV